MRCGISQTSWLIVRRSGGGQLPVDRVCPKFGSHLQRSLRVTCITARAMATKHLMLMQRSNFEVEEQGGTFGSHHQRRPHVTCSPASTRRSDHLGVLATLPISVAGTSQT